MASVRLSELCQVIARAGLAARLDGPDVLVHSVNTLEEAGPGQITFLSNPKYLSAVSGTKASAVVLKNGIDIASHVSAIRCSDPYAAITAAIITIHGHRRHPQWGVSPAATIDPSSQIGRSANIAPGVTIAAEVVLGDNCTIYPGCYLAEGVRVGCDCTLFPNVVIYDHCVLGDRVTIHAGSVIGEDGLGYAPHQDRWVKIPQIGRAVLGDDVEIGANCTIDRATLGQTEIGAGTKFGNVVVIGHGTKVGSDCMFVGLVGVAGSVTIGRHVTVAGQVGVAGHLSIGDEVVVGAQAGVLADVEAKATVLGSPAMPIHDTKRALAVFAKLPDWVKRIRSLEQEVQQLREQIESNGRAE